MGLVYSATSALAKFVALNFFQLQVFGRENILEEGPALLAMNHQSFLDPPFAGICCHREIHYLARKTLFDIPLVGRALRHLNLVGVERDGTDMSALKNVIRILRSGGCTIVFPEGTRTHDGQLQPASAGVGLVIAKTLAPVVPIRIFGAFEAFPRTAKLPRRAPVTIVVGEPLRFTKEDIAGDPRVVYQRLSDAVMGRIAALQNPRQE